MDLQTALVVAGIVLLLLVVAYNQWQIRKSRRPRALQPEDDVPPMREPVVGGSTKPEVSAKLHETPPPDHIERREPTLTGGAAAVGDATPAARTAGTDEAGDATLAAAAASAAQSADADDQIAEEVAYGTGQAARGDAAARAAVPPAAVQSDEQGDLAVIEGQPRPAVIDPLIDCIVPLHLERKASGDRILPLTGRLRRAGTKQVHIEGLREAANAWEPVTAGHQYEDIQVAVQLANRSGPLNALEFSEFVNAVEGLAEALDASAELPDMTETVANARELDNFAATCDVQLGVNVISDGAPWSAAYVQSVATQDGLVLSRDGTRFTRYQADQDGIQRALFTLQFGDTNFLRDDLTVKAGHQITLLLDVPQAAQPAKPLKLMCEYGDSLAQRMGARLVDDNMRPLTEASFVAIFTQLQALYDKLDARGMPAGSPVALRLFSN
ncbi:cell division protein ZipA C-terminal FtsZ-binding domain-containing protein [Cupriavidus respiraculi]|uniref:Cell division protein ZipA n=1 Tax=Cupriavidus respiraculi TaxID=195930 RepID=A0ABN7Z9F9_9BURK|nr:cell division protein ZipA C-terminal FtsZ-binding domain-containing protein [Cupriavidus respiraculi]CAG9180946.1 hypothetical protein LMG21510_04165 [Cupriavidus respiraculi]